MLINLLSNAIKFSPSNSRILVSVTARVSANKLSPNMTEVTFAVSDQGPGVSTEDQKKLFSTYLQIRPGALQQGQGTGVGLSLCKQIVTLHGGTISCVSEAGMGSTFIFTIPFGVAAPHLEEEANGYLPSANGGGTRNTALVDRRLDDYVPVQSRDGDQDADRERNNGHDDDRRLYAAVSSTSIYADAADSSLSRNSSPSHTHSNGGTNTPALVSKPSNPPAQYSAVGRVLVVDGKFKYPSWATIHLIQSLLMPACLC